jgi:hypothetical protein
MTSESSVQTAHGMVDAAALEAAQGSFDTGVLLQSVDEIDEVVRQLSGEGGLRDQLLQLHAMASTILNGAGISSSTGTSLPEAAADVIEDVREVVSVLRRTVDRTAPLAALSPSA